MKIKFVCIAFLLTFIKGVQLDQSLDDFINEQVKASRQGVLANIGGINGTNVPGVLDGVVVASPSRFNYFCWTRNAAITFQALIERFIYGITWLEPLIKSYVDSVKTIQGVENLSGQINTGGLGEPKFYPNQTSFMEPWARPQRDGPALRASALMDYGLSIYSTQEPYVTDVLWPIIKTDLDYVVGYWNMSGFDLWEEMKGSSFFTIAVQHKTLRKGFEFSSLFGITNSTYFDHSGLLLCFLQSFWSDGHVEANINVENNRSGLDASTILASIHTFSPDLGCDERTFQPCSSRALANHKRVVDSFRTIYEINRAASSNTPVAIGRYPEDDYYGGNPWYSTTLAAAEQLYDALNMWQQLNQVNVTEISLEFFQAIAPGISVGSYGSDSPIFHLIISNVQSYAEGFLSIIRNYTPPLGPIHEQFSKLSKNFHTFQNKPRMLLFRDSWTQLACATIFLTL
ncbi:hypothetical protein CROQUDRAFT_674179 [Cronartium quercuum f. sp. fusiforme G11]|uniref:glucan 1,4-alpha-glucosidase n=1 Tax=Cronartium quercuum f. sp. fusiforme G11 TaxID=708437 RepID=A0A9P6T798_9BASI|nr:hypothetical protein CROQUDRAFT_674179 [Cronartium quercuum f. sp. fusiforme G11]